jgi:hypothetical protein
MAILMALASSELSAMEPLPDGHKEKCDLGLELDETLTDFALGPFSQRIIQVLMNKHGLSKEAAEKIANIRTCK